MSEERLNVSVLNEVCCIYSFCDFVFKFVFIVFIVEIDIFLYVLYNFYVGVI